MFGAKQCFINGFGSLLLLLICVSVHTKSISSETSTIEAELPKGYKKVDDMLLPIFQPMSARLSQRWTRSPYGIVFLLSSGFTSGETAVIKSAANEIARYSCVKINVVSEYEFAQNKFHWTNYVFVSRFWGGKFGGCYSQVGMRNGRQTLNLDPNWNCIQKGTVMHEMIHSLGYEHEQCRIDRDNYINIDFNNIKSDQRDNFKVHWGTTPIGTYDINSIMHYGAYDFAVNSRYPVITSKIFNKQVPARSSEFLNAQDQYKIKYITGCK